MSVCVSQGVWFIFKEGFGTGMNSAMEVKQRCKGMWEKTMSIKMESLLVGWERDESAVTLSPGGVCIWHNVHCLERRHADIGDCG